jgi:hypothetical protein
MVRVYRKDPFTAPRRTETGLLTKRLDALHMDHLDAAARCLSGLPNHTR